MKRLGLIALPIALMFFFLAGPLYAKRPMLRCTDLTTENLALKGVVITHQEEVADQYGAYCKVSGKVNERTGLVRGADGQPQG